MTIDESHKSPNKNFRPYGAPIDLIVIHGTAGSDSGDLSWLLADGSDVSYHYLIHRDGTIHHLVPDVERAWHAGKSSWLGRDHCNDYSIGIGISNKGPREAYTDWQYEAAAQLVQTLRDDWGIPWDRVVGHCHISPGRKDDPWLHFHWPRIFR